MCRPMKRRNSRAQTGAGLIRRDILANETACLDGNGQPDTIASDSMTQNVQQATVEKNKQQNLTKACKGYDSISPPRKKKLGGPFESNNGIKLLLLFRDRGVRLCPRM